MLTCLVSSAADCQTVRLEAGSKHSVPCHLEVVALSVLHWAFSWRHPLDLRMGLQTRSANI